MQNVQGLGILKQKFQNTPVLALTATATASVKEDVVQALGLVNCIVFRQSFNRPNLWLVLNKCSHPSKKKKEKKKKKLEVPTENRIHRSL